MAQPCNGALLVEMLLRELSCENKNQLAKKLGVKAASIQAWERTETLTTTVVKNVIKKIRDAAIRESITPIAEFRPLNHLHGNNVDTLRKKIDDEELCETLSSQKGIYAFYDSNGKIIYVGKTQKNNLLSEMTQAFKIKRANFSRKLAKKNGKFAVHQMSIKDTAEFFSAYLVDEHAIGNVEAFLTRIIPNDVVNKRTENFKLG